MLKGKDKSLPAGRSKGQIFDPLHGVFVAAVHGRALAIAETTEKKSVLAQSTIAAAMKAAENSIKSVLNVLPMIPSPAARTEVESGLAQIVTQDRSCCGRPPADTQFRHSRTGRQSISHCRAKLSASSLFINHEY
ncbi:hypothetical protein M2281_004285 [Mesorhizobium soli]|uniref:hypothetical protein n=1 Tax=Pseudaminobacter soli (ex Li et al. 2025) TaxID=1295366 RepID=UPI002473E2E8|nr:hypothetical protein [Mesorhizobium soli]MDH6233674.1 hypothetical protein [Mesorhizobium soli]